MSDPDAPILLEKFRQLVNISQRIKKAEVAAVLGLTEIDLIHKLMEWGKDIPFKIDGDFIVIDSLTGVTDAIDAQFAQWSETGGEKIDSRNKKVKMSDESDSGDVINVISPEIVQRPPVARKKVRMPLSVPLAYPIRYPTINLVDPEEMAVITSMESLMTKTTTTEKLIPQVDHNELQSFGYSVEDGHVVGLWLVRRGLLSIPDSIGNLRLLRSLNLSGNKITQLPASICTLDSLTRLDIENNDLLRIPENIGHLHSLRMLILKRNGLARIPPSIHEMSKLEELYLDENQLTTLPPEIGRLITLKVLRVSNNTINALPATITNLKSLSTLDMQNNKLPLFSLSLRKWMGELQRQGCKIYR
jgi:hypothetical protein